MGLDKYRSKRDFQKTGEPEGDLQEPQEGAFRFVVQKHQARRLHYDLRLEIDGVLRSWAVPKGPSRDPAEKRRAIQVEAHPLEYGDFEGVIPSGQYSASKVIVWDRGTFECLGAEKDPTRAWSEVALSCGRRAFTLNTILRRLESKGDLFKEVRTNLQSLHDALRELGRLWEDGGGHD